MRRGVLAGQKEDDDASNIDSGHTLKHIILTGHKDGKILIWRLHQIVGVLDDYGCEVTAMTKCYEGVAFSTIKGVIYIWDEYLLGCNKIIDINKLPFKILSPHIVSMDFNQRRILVLTLNGDVIDILLSAAGISKTIKANRINTIVRITGNRTNALTILY